MVVGRTDDDYGARIHVVTPGAPARLLYEHAEDAGVADLSEDGTLVAISHSEHGDSRHPALRVVRTMDGEPIADLWDGPGKGVEAFGFAPLAGDTRVLVGHERRGRAELLIWDVATGEQTELHLDVEGEIADADWFLDGGALLVAVDHDARTRLYRYDLSGGGLRALGRPDGSVRAATPRPDGDVWTLWSSAAEPPSVRDLAGTVVLEAPGDLAPPSVPVDDVWVDGPGGRVHALLRRPQGDRSAAPGRRGARRPDPRTTPTPSAPPPRPGSTTGSRSCRSTTAAPPATARPGATPSRPASGTSSSRTSSPSATTWWSRASRTRRRVVLAGASWGGFLTLLGLGTYPERWALGLAGVPVADYVAAYEDEMEGLKAFDRSLFGGSPEEVPEKYRDASPLTYVDAVRAPVLILAGENDPRCPIRQIENYVARARAAPADRRSTRCTGTTPGTARSSTTRWCGRCAPSSTSWPGTCSTDRPVGSGQIAPIRSRWVSARARTGMTASGASTVTERPPSCARPVCSSVHVVPGGRWTSRCRRRAARPAPPGGRGRRQASSTVHERGSSGWP